MEGVRVSILPRLFFFVALISICSGAEYYDQYKLVCESGDETAYICDHSVSRSSEFGYPRLTISHNCDSEIAEHLLQGTFKDSVDDVVNDQSSRAVRGLKFMRLVSYDCHGTESIKVVQQTSSTTQYNLCGCPPGREALVVMLKQRFK